MDILLFRPSVLYIRIHEFPIFVIPYSEGWALAAGIEIEKERGQVEERGIRDGVWLTDEYCDSNGPCFIDYTERTIL
jgi:hypothetical protein